MALHSDVMVIEKGGSCSYLGYSGVIWFGGGRVTLSHTSTGPLLSALEFVFDV